MQTEYWATKQGTELASELKKKIESYDNYLNESGLLQELRDSYNTFYGDSKIRNLGDKGELKAITINHYSSLIRNLVSMVTNTKPAWQPISANSDNKSQASSILAGSLLDYYMKEKRVDRLFRNAVTMTCFLRESFISSTWDTTQGNIIGVDPDTKLPVHEGDLVYNLYSLLDIIRDYNKKDNANPDWIITREYKNKYDLIAQFPEYENQLDSIKYKSNEIYRFTPQLNSNDESDLIPFYTFYFKSCAALPNGRMVTFIQDQILTDGALPYPRIPIIKLSVEDTIDSAFSHSPMLDVLPIQKAINTMASTILTNNSAFGVQSIWSKKGNGLSVSEIASGLNLLESDVKPEPIQLTASSSESYKFLDTLIQQSQLLSGVSSVVRGEAPAGMSGSAMALLSNQSLQFMNSLQAGYTALIEDVGTLSLNILQTYANTKRIATLVGKHNKPMLKEWSAKDLDGIQRVTIDSGNSLSKTASGRLTIAQDLLQQGLIKDPQQYLMVLQTGNIENLYEHETSYLLKIRAENEMLSEGKIPTAILTDPHEIEIKEHLTVLDSPDARNNPQIVQSVLSHVQEHINLAKSIPPELMVILGRQPLPQIEPILGQSNGQSPEVMTNENPMGQAAQKINQPSMPNDAMTGEQFKPQQ